MVKTAVSWSILQYGHSGTEILSLGSVLQVYPSSHWTSHTSHRGAEVPFYPEKVQEKYKTKRKFIYEFVDCPAVSGKWIFIDSLSLYGLALASKDPELSSGLGFQSDCLCSWHTPLKENLALSICALMGMVLSHLPVCCLHKPHGQNLTGTVVPAEHHRQGWASAEFRPWPCSFCWHRCNITNAMQDDWCTVCMRKGVQNK